jgi:hypothetical protein
MKFLKSSSATPQKSKTPSLVFCIIMDLIGYATFSLPLIGEALDLVWAPISAMIFFRTFGGWKGAFGGMFNFIEEILPFMDFIPTFTITWGLQQLFAGKKAARPMNITSIQTRGARLQ